MLHPNLTDASLWPNWLPTPAIIYPTAHDDDNQLTPITQCSAPQYLWLSTQHDQPVHPQQHQTGPVLTDQWCPTKTTGPSTWSVLAILHLTEWTTLWLTQQNPVYGLASYPTALVQPDCHHLFNPDYPLALLRSCSLCTSNAPEQLPPCLLP